MKRSFYVYVCLLGLLCLWTTQALAEKSTFVVLPFSVKGPQGFAYLERSIPQMLSSRLYQKDQVVPAIQDLPASQKPALDNSSAEKARKNYKSDYVIWGTVTILGDDYSLDVKAKDKQGKVWPFSREGRTNQLITAVRGVSDEISKELFGIKVPAATNSQGITPVNQMNSDIVVNQDTPKDVYLNPQFRYAGGNDSDSARIRSQSLPFSSIGMEICDADGDGNNEIFLLSSSKLYAYTFKNKKLEPAGEFAIGLNYKAISIRSLKRSNGKSWLVVNILDKKGLPMSSIFSYSNKKLKEEMSKIKYFLNVVKMPPNYTPTLIGQQSQPPKLFAAGIYEMIPQNGELVRSGRVNLPKELNVFNFAYLPGDRNDAGGSKLIMLSDREKLRVLTPDGKRLAETDETYSGSSAGLDVGVAMPGLGKDNDTLSSKYYIPMRIVPTDLNRNGKYELLVNRPISTASTIFDRYRFFPQSEIHSLGWDGVGLNLQWKTRRIKGSTVDYTIADANNDGVLDLVVCVNTHPGSLGVKTRKTVILMYPLDMARQTRTPDNSDVFD